MHLVDNQTSNSFNLATKNLLKYKAPVIFTKLSPIIFIGLLYPCRLHNVNLFKNCVEIVKRMGQ